MAAGPATTLHEPLTKLLLAAACLHATSGCGQQAALSCCSNIAAARAIAEAATAADVVKGAESTWLNVEPLPMRSAGGLSLSTTQCLPAANVAKVPKIKAASGGTLGCDVNVWEKPAAPLRTTVPRALAGECFNDELRQIAAPAAPADDARA